MGTWPDHYLTFDNLDDALRAFEMPVGNVPAVREVMAGLDVATYYVIEDSAAYIGVEGHRGPPNLAYINKGHIDMRGDNKAWTRHVLPENSLGGRRGSGRRGAQLDVVPDVCPVCSYALPVSGICGECE
ncbi:hypothetical protein [Demequina sp.]|uniref:hypothetical protein n=1 Tax=Demequina sp. TaxID=2050685 RepID=UPI003A863E87